MPTHLQVVAGLDGIALRDGSSLTPDSQVVSANTMVSRAGFLGAETFLASSRAAGLHKSHLH